MKAAHRDYRLVLFGGPGSGKGTQAEVLCGRFGLDHISTGDMLREAVRQGTETGQEAGRYMEAGRLVPDDVVAAALFQRLGDEPSGFLLDGFPRTEPQAEALDRRLDAVGAPLDLVIEMQVPDEVLAERLTGRRHCPDCGKAYHVRFVPPHEEGRCDACGGALDRRPDDVPEVVSERLAVYHRQTSPLRDHYQRRGLLASVDADQPVDDVSRDLLECLTEHAGRRG